MSIRRSITQLAAGLCLTGLLASAPLSAAPAVRLPPIAVRVLPGTDASVLGNLVNVIPVKGQAPAVLQLDLAHKRILDGKGQTVVELTTGSPISLQGAVDKWRYAAAFARLAAAHPQELHIDWGHLGARAGQTPFLYDRENVAVVMTNVTAGRQLLLFAFDATGTLGLLYITGSDAGVVNGSTVAVGIVAMAPFGVDHIVAVSASEPQRLPQLAAWVAESARARGMLDTEGSILEQIMALRDVRVGVLSLYTCRSSASCGR
jgi:hypothetical protein